MVFLAGANDLVTAFVALEVLSFALYVLASLARRDRRSQEAGLKYFVTGAVASAVLLYGLALLYVATGTLSIPAIGAGITSVLVPRGVALAGLVLVTVGVAFKVALVPFHFWTPDVYQGSPTNITAFMAAATKAAAFALLLRLYLVAFPGLRAWWVPALAVLAAATMLYGAFAALAQHDVKRILAYSSITHAGYATIGVVAVSRAGLSATLFYLLTYSVGTIAAFSVVIAVERRRRGEVTLATLRGLGRTSPLLAGILSLSLLSLAGLPLTAGFIGKLEVFRAGVNAGLAWLVLIGVLSSLVAAYFYLRIAGIMFLEEPVGADGSESAEAAEARQPLLSAGLSSATAIAAALVVVLGVQPQLLLELAGHAGVLLR
jgi:NADH-quinone oxidoreductase subunit N